MDLWSKKKRSEVMAKIPSKDTKPEIMLRSILHRLGYRFRIHKKELPGKPDIVLSKYNTVIYVHGCFWHFHEECSEGRIPSSNTDYWKNKLLNNVARDKRHKQDCEALGWKVIIIWECEIENDIDKVIQKLERKYFE